MSTFTDSYKLINASTTTVTDPVASLGTNTLDVSQRELMSIQFTSTGIAAGNGVFKVYVSNDGSNWVQYNRLVDNLTKTNAQTDTMVSSVTLSSNTSKIYFFAPSDHFRYVGASVTVTTDGSYTALLQTVS